jgi:hypothetical protein
LVKLDGNLPPPPEGSLAYSSLLTLRAQCKIKKAIGQVNNPARYSQGNIREHLGEAKRAARLACRQTRAGTFFSSSGKVFAMRQAVGICLNLDMPPI